MAFPQIDTPSAGPLTVADLDAARKHSTGNVWIPSPHRSFLPLGDEYPEPNMEPCAPEGGKHNEPASAMESMLRHRRTSANVKAGAAFVALVAVVSFCAQIA